MSAELHSLNIGSPSFAPPTDACVGDTVLVDLKPDVLEICRLFCSGRNGGGQSDALMATERMDSVILHDLARKAS